MFGACHSCYIYGTWRSKEVGRGEVLESSSGGVGGSGGGGRASCKGGTNFHGRGS